MSYKSVWGFGGCKIYTTGTSSPVTLMAGGVGNFTFTPVWQEATNWKNQDISRLLGYSVDCDIELLNIKYNDYVQIQNLMSILSAHNNNNTDLTIYPRWVPDLVGWIPRQRGYEDFRLDSNIELIEGDRLELFQTISLKFKKRSLVNWIPAHTSYRVDVPIEVENGTNIESLDDGYGNTFVLDIF